MTLLLQPTKKNKKKEVFVSFRKNNLKEVLTFQEEPSAGLHSFQHYGT